MLNKLLKPLRLLRSGNPNKRTVIASRQHPLRADAHISAHALTVTRRLQQAGFQAYPVGGCVRDLLLDLAPKDFDVATNATPEQVRAEFRNARIIGRRFKLVHVLFGREMIEVATFRGHHTDSDSKQTAQHESGRILRDNQYGSLEEDAERRDFSINALYFDVKNNSILDYTGGFADIKKRQIRLIGDPEQRYREDPVRMLRAVRFAAKLAFSIEEKTAAPITQLAPLLAAIPSARLFEEVLKLFLSGHAAACYPLLRQYGLFEQLFPATTRLLDTPCNERLIRQALANTDQRIAEGKPVTPTFLFAALLWPVINQQALRLKDEGVPPIPALQEAASIALAELTRRIALPKRFSLPLREMVEMQERLLRRSLPHADILLTEPRFRAAYDLLLLREQAGEETGGLGAWWTDYQYRDEHQRRQMIKNLPKSAVKKRKRRPRKKPAIRHVEE